MGRSSIMVKLARCMQAFPLWLFGFLEWPFIFFLAKPSNKAQAIFVLALPRSGSTVTYQAICHGLSVQYLSNIWNLLYQLPLLGGWLSFSFSKRHRSDFHSEHGFVSGLGGPAEGLRFWHRWLDCGLSDADCKTVSLGTLKRRSDYLSKVLSVLTRSQGPFVTAYLGHSLVPDRIFKAFPGAVLIRLRRDPVSNALSLLKATRAAKSKWFSVLTDECLGFSGSSEYERVAAQVYWLNRRLDDAACSSHFLTVDYESLCENPEREVRRIKDWCIDKGISVKNKFSLPETFEQKVIDFDNNQDAVRIKKALDKLEKNYGKLGGENER